MSSDYNTFDVKNLDMLTEWALEYYKTHSKGRLFKEANVAFNTNAGTSFEIDLKIKNLEELLVLLPSTKVKEFFDTYRDECKKYLAPMSKKYDKDKKDIYDAIDTLKGNGISINFLRENPCSMEDFMKAIKCRKAMVEEADPSKWLVRNMNADLVDKEKWVYTPSPKVSLLLDQRESLVNSGQRKIVEAIDELVQQDKECQLAESVIYRIDQLEFSYEQREALPKTCSWIDSVKRNVHSRYKALTPQIEKRAEAIINAIRKVEIKQTRVQEKSERMQAKQERAQIAKPKNDDTYNSSLSEEEKNIKDIEASIDVHNKIILNARKEQEKLMVKEPGSDEVHIIDQRLYDSYEVDITMHQNEINSLQRQKDELLQNNKYSAAWKEARKRFEEKSIFSRMMLSLQGKHPKNLESGPKELSPEDVEGLYK